LGAIQDFSPSDSLPTLPILPRDTYAPIGKSAKTEFNLSSNQLAISIQPHLFCVTSSVLVAMHEIDQLLYLGS
jgi:hypothetical protein